MKILLVSDKESPYYWDYYQPGRLDGIDLIISCGDLKANYLSFLVTMGRARVLYVHGNHDRTYEMRPPEGCDCIEDKLVTVNGLRILGLGGSIQYSGGPHQYTERQMARRIRKLRFQLWRAGAWIWWSPTPRPRATATGRTTPTGASSACCPFWTGTSPCTWSTDTST